MLKGYYVPSGYMGLVYEDDEVGKYILFASESDYAEYMEESAQMSMFVKL